MRKVSTRKSFNVHCVFGEGDAKNIEDLLIPSLSRNCSQKIDFVGLNFTPGSQRKLLKPEVFSGNVRTMLTPQGVSRGFAENHNLIYRESKPEGPFLVINPDCIAEDGLIDTLIDTYENCLGQAAIVEARQWPFEHPKEFDRLSKETPWASGACSLIDSEFFEVAGGMDERFFLYMEDVDLSWQAWKLGWRVLYETNAVVMHFTGGPHYSPDEWPHESLYALRNHLLLVEKHFGEQALESAISQLKTILQEGLHESVMAMFRAARRSHPKSVPTASIHPMMKNLGPGMYHELRR